MRPNDDWQSRGENRNEDLFTRTSVSAQKITSAGSELQINVSIVISVLLSLHIRSQCWNWHTEEIYKGNRLRNWFTCFKKSVFSYCPVLQHHVPPLSKTLLTSGSLRPQLPNAHSALIGHLMHAWPSISMWCHKVTELKKGLLMRRFRSSIFLWERGASVGADFDLFNFQDLLHAQEDTYKTEGKENKWKSIIGLL